MTRMTTPQEAALAVAAMTPEALRELVSVARALQDAHEACNSQAVRDALNLNIVVAVLNTLKSFVTVPLAGHFAYAAKELRRADRGLQENMRFWISGRNVILHEEPFNQYDPNAIRVEAVWQGNTHKLGYVAAAMTAAVRVAFPGFSSWSGRLMVDGGTADIVVDGGCR